MARAELAALIATAFLIFTFVRYRIRLHRRRREGPSLELLGRFDYRVVLSELEALIDAGAGARSRAAASQASYSAAPDFLSRSPWAVRPDGTAGAIFDVLASGKEPVLGSPEAVSLASHFTVVRLLEGDLEGAERLADSIDAPQARLASAAISLARAERYRATRDEAASLREAAKAERKATAVRRELPDSPGPDSVLLHVQLGWKTHALNLEWSVAMAQHRLRRLLHRFEDTPQLHLAQAWAHALVGEHEAALDALGRALYFSRGDPFYARAVMESPFVARSRPALLAQCRGVDQMPVA